jgi:cytochrome P450
MTTTHLGSKLWVVINSNRLVQELYGRLGSATNGRPKYPMVSDLISQGRRSVLLPPKEWQERRRVMHQLLSGSALRRYQTYQDEESMKLLANYCENPEKWFAHNHTYSNSVIHRITFGQRPDSSDRQLMEEVMRVQFEFLKNAPPFNLWDCFPELAKLPNILQWWRAPYVAIGEATNRAYSAYWNPIKSAIEQGQSRPSFARDLVMGEGKYSGSGKDQMFLSMQLVEAGSDTTRLATNIFILAAVSHPDKFAKARRIIDEVCGKDAERLPVFEDEDRLAYINAFAKEMLRWRRIFAWTPEHTLTTDLEFEGYRFPEGTNFVINHVSIANDESNFEDPQDLKPERWLDGHESELWEGNWQFGAGRRLCVGNRLAQKSLFILLSRLIYCFDFKRVSQLPIRHRRSCLAELATDILQRAPFDDQNINHFAQGEPFPISVSVRSAKHAALIKETVGNLEEE